MWQDIWSYMANMHINRNMLNRRTKGLLATRDALDLGHILCLSGQEVADTMEELLQLAKYLENQLLLCELS